jgi:zinc transporter ZupT
MKKQLLIATLSFLAGLKAFPEFMSITPWGLSVVGRQSHDPSLDMVIERTGFFIVFLALTLLVMAWPWPFSKRKGRPQV